MLTKSGLRLGIGLPTVFRDGRVDTDLIREFATRAESLGYEDLWLAEGILGAQGRLESVTLLTYAAACTRRIRLGIAVIILNQRNPVVLAKTLSSLDQLSGGRLIVGVGLGSGTALYPAFGISAERPVARFTEGLRVMRALWSEERVNLEGEHWRLENVAMEPKPLQKPHLPVWIGAHASPALRRAVHLGDGWMGPGGSSIEDFFVEIEQVRKYIKEFGRDEASFPVSKRVYITVDHDEQKARERNESRRAHGEAVAGTPKQCVAVLRSLRDAGLNHLLLDPFGDPMQQLELLTTEVAPEL